MKKRIVVASFVVLMGLLLATGCGLTPQFTYQGVLTDSSGTPLSGAVKITYTIYDAENGGTALYHETETKTLIDGRFDSVVGPSTVVGGLSPEDLAQPLWIEVQVNQGTITETLTPRQQLYGAPYAFTLMPGTVISDSFDATVDGAAGIRGIVTIVNKETSDPLPALRVQGVQGIELSDLSSSSDSNIGTIYSDQNFPGSDLKFVSNDHVIFSLDSDNSESTGFYIYNGTGSLVWYVTESGNMYASGTKSSVVQVDGQSRALYAVESPDVWFEDFGSGQLTNGQGFVEIDPLFAKSVNLNMEYHVFLTPLGDCNGLYIANKTATGFEVRELSGGTANVAFDYRIVAKRAGYEDVHMEVVPMDVEEEK